MKTVTLNKNNPLSLLREISTRLNKVEAATVKPSVSVVFLLSGDPFEAFNAPIPGSPDKQRLQHISDPAPIPKGAKVYLDRAMLDAGTTGEASEPDTIEEPAGEGYADGNRAFRPCGKQREFIQSQDLVCVLEGPADTGKTRTAFEKIHRTLEMFPGARALYFRQTRAACTDTGLVTYEDKVLPAGHYLRQGAQREQRHSYKYRNGSELVVGGLDDPEKHFSSEYDIIYGQEATQTAEKNVETLLRALRNGKTPYPQLILDLNPTHNEFWLYHWEEQARARLFYIGHRDNPSFSPEREAVLAALKGPARERLYLGKRVSEVEGTFYGKSMYEARVTNRIQTRLQLDPAMPVGVCFDLGIHGGSGLGSGYMALWWFQVIGEEWRWLKYYESHGEGLAHYASVMEEYQRETRCTYGYVYFPHDGNQKDVGSGKTRKETMEALGFNVMVVPRYDRENAFETVNNKLARARFDETGCSVGIQRVIAFRRKKDEATGMFLPHYVHDEASHGATALETGVMGYVPPSSYKRLKRSKLVSGGSCGRAGY